MMRHSLGSILKAGLAGAALLGLSACASAALHPPVTAPSAGLEMDQWRDQVRVQVQADEILLAVHAAGVSTNQDAALRALAGRWLDAQAHDIVIAAPTGDADAADAGRMAAQVRARLIAYGAPGARVRIDGFDASAQPGAPLRVAFERQVATGPRCGQSWENLSATRENAVHENFGCAIAANRAAQIANPEDLIRPRDSDPIDAGRRDVVLGKYRKGEVTSSARDDQARGVIARAID